MAIGRVLVVRRILWDVRSSERRDRDQAAGFSSGFLSVDRAAQRGGSKNLSMNN